MVICPMRFGQPFTKMVDHFSSLQYMKHSNTPNAKHKPLGGSGGMLPSNF